MTTLDDLIARLSAATRASRELDAEIACAVGYPATLKLGDEALGNERIIPRNALRYTGSLDAAMTLCSYGMHSIEFRLEPGGWVVSIDGFTATAATRELAVSAAALKARKARP